MRRGRKPKPTRLKVMNGSLDHDPNRANKAEPKPPKTKPTKPRKLTGVAAKKWTEVTTLLDYMQVLTSADRDVLELYCVTYANWSAAVDNVKKTGQVIVKNTKGNEVAVERNPFSAELHKYSDRLMKLQAELGLSPSSRSRVSVVKAALIDPLIEMRERHLG